MWVLAPVVVSVIGEREFLLGRADGWYWFRVGCFCVVWFWVALVCFLCIELWYFV